MMPASWIGASMWSQRRTTSCPPGPMSRPASPRIPWSYNGAYGTLPDQLVQVPQLSGGPLPELRAGTVPPAQPGVRCQPFPQLQAGTFQPGKGLTTMGAPYACRLSVDGAGQTVSQRGLETKTPRRRSFSLPEPPVKPNPDVPDGRCLSQETRFLSRSRCPGQRGGGIGFGTHLRLVSLSQPTRRTAGQ